MWFWVRQLGLMLTDALAINAGVVIALLIRFDGKLPAREAALYESMALAWTVLTLVVFWRFGFYRTIWKYASMDEMLALLGGTSTSAVIMVGLVYGMGLKGFPRSVVILSWLVNMLLVGGLRFSVRMGHRLASRRNGRPVPAIRNTLIIGAGDAGAMVVKELQKHPELGYRPAGFLDDDPNKRKLQIHGVPVLGSREDVERVVTGRDIEEIIIAIPSASGRTIREIVSRCEGLGARLKIVPGVYELLDGKVSVNQIREVRIEDLLGREPVEIDLEEIAGYLKGERVLVTGAGGSIGSELCRQVARFQPGELLLLDNSENGVFETSLDLQYCFPDLQQQVMVADIREREKMHHLFDRHHPGVVFHAAAHKHVPLMEDHPDEAVKTNIFGTRNVAEAALEYGVKKFVLISTDKAVNPTSVMGATKRVAEMVVQALDAERRQRNPAGARFVAVRFGNVLGSRGSVVPIFKEQIARGGPVTVTHPEMRRYFMTIPEAVQLVVQAGAMGEGGEIFILDMGEPVRILELAENLIRLSGFEPGVDIPIVFTGPRPGEKFFEEILTAEEGTVATRHRRIYVGSIRNVEPAWLEKHLASLSEIVYEGHAPDRLLSRLRELVPNLRPSWWAQTAAACQAEGSSASGVVSGKEV